ncbi:MAG TPA: UvrB/UvrC motif-containing protein [Candidatus Paceibacterota bacterium]|jgi:excinuclease ABC subunit C|nr:UvrB/UvrC motif-containing protein [Candidatus Paceibacterota bacterium]
MNLDQFKRRMKKLPDEPGVYFFLGKNKKLLYIGKATSLRDRVRSYFAKDLMDTRGPLLVEMLDKAATIDWRQTDSVLEALLLEASLIRTHRPYYNTDLKDDKSFNRVVITKEDYPRVLVIRGKNLEAECPPDKRAYTFGPFPHGLQLQQAMKLIRKIFPYRTKCEPCEASAKKGRMCKPCFDATIGLCPGVCSGAVGKKEYRQTIRHIVLLFQGKKKLLVKSMKREMKQAAKEERFEEAGRLKEQLFGLTHIQDVSLIKDEYRSQNPAQATRIEAYDIAHLAGSGHVGVMTVVEGGLPNKMEYRKFNIHTAKGGDDPGSLREVLSRRLGHNEWPLPKLIVVDGSTAQINAAQKVLNQYGIQIPVVGVVKDEKHRPKGISGDRNAIKDRERDILLANAEAHRFAITFNRKKMRKRLGL